MQLLVVPSIDPPSLLEVAVDDLLGCFIGKEESDAAASSFCCCRCPPNPALGCALRPAREMPLRLFFPICCALEQL